MKKWTCAGFQRCFMTAGHGPFSHVFEQLLIKDLEKTHEDITSWIIEKSEVGDKLSKMGYKPQRGQRTCRWETA